MQKVIEFFYADEVTQEGQQGATTADPMDSLYRDVFSDVSRVQTTVQSSTDRTVSNQSCDTKPDQSDNRTKPLSVQQDGHSETLEQQHQRERLDQEEETQQQDAQTKVEINQPIGSLRGTSKAGSADPLTLRGQIDKITNEEIRQNRESDDGIRSIPRFHNYQPGNPSKVKGVLLNLFPGSLQKMTIFFFFSFLLHPSPAGALCQEPQCTGLSGPAGGAVFQI